MSDTNRDFNIARHYGDILKKQLDEYTSVTRKFIPESLLVKYYLPRIWGDEEMTTKDITDWITITGGIGKDVIVVSDETGEFLFIAPPLQDTTRSLSTNNSVSNNSGSKTYAEIIQITENLSKIQSLNPNQNIIGQAEFLSKSVENQIISKPLNPDILTGWAVIFEKYGYVLHPNHSSSDTVLEDDELMEYVPDKENG